MSTYFGEEKKFVVPNWKGTKVPRPSSTEPGHSIDGANARIEFGGAGGYAMVYSVRVYYGKIMNPYSPVVTICTAQWSLYVPHSSHYMHRTVVTICTVQWPLYVPHSGHYTYRTMVTIRTTQWSLYVPHNGHYMYRTVVNIRTTQWSLNVPHSGHYMHRTLVTICTEQWSLYVPHSGHYMYRTVVTTCTAQWSLYVPHSGHYMYHQFKIQQLYVLLHTAVFMCYVWISEQTAIISLYNIN